MGSSNLTVKGLETADRLEERAAPSRRIGVVHLLHTVAYGGPETIIINWLGAQDRERFDVHLLVFSNPHATERPFVDAAVAAGLSIHFIPWNRWKPVMRCGRDLAAYVRANQIDIVHCYNSYAEMVGVAAKRLTGVRLVCTKWMWGKFDWKRGVLQRIERMMLPSFDRVTAQSEFAARLTGLRGKQVDVLISGLEQPLYPYTAEERNAARAELSAGPDDIVLLHLARFYPEKAHDVLVRSFQTIVREEPQARLWLTGVGPTLEPTKQLVAELGLEESVRFLGFRADLDKLLPLVDIQIHSSNMEGIPLALCSGLSAGLPVVATAIGGVPEIVVDGVSGLLVPCDEPGLLAEAALRVVRDPELRKQLGAGGTRFMEQTYSLKAAVNRLESLYEEMMTA